MDEIARRVRFQVFAFYLEHCRPPTIHDITSATGVTDEQALRALQQLNDQHHIVLHKAGVHTPSPIAMAHPFSHLPTPFVVIHGDRSWWANCAWCAFGLASMLLSNPSSDSPITVRAKSGTVDQEMVFKVTQDGIKPQSGFGHEETCIVHYSAPPSTWWTDVGFACGTIHIFKDQRGVIDWCDRYSFNFGEVMDMGTMWKLAKTWYEKKATYDFDRFSIEEKDKLFAELGLTSPFWTQ